MGCVLAVCGLAREARIAAGDGVEAIQAGSDPTRLRALLSSRTGPTIRAVVSFGIAGGLDPNLAPGDVVIGLGVVAEQRFPAASIIVERLERRLASSGLRIVVADLAGVDAPAMNPNAKAALRAATGAATVDMESHVAASYAAQRGIPFGAVRVVCDPAERALPAFAAHALKPDGEPDILSVLAALMRREARIGEVLRLAKDSGAAFRSLGRARALLGLSLGVDA